MNQDKQATKEHRYPLTLSFRNFKPDSNPKIEEQVPPLGFDQIQVTYENLKGWRNNEMMDIATFDHFKDAWVLHPEFTPEGVPTAPVFSDYYITSTRSSSNP